MGMARQLPMLESYLAAGYDVTGDGTRLTLTCPAAKFERCLPQLSHCYVRKLFDSIPALYLCRPISDKVRLSQIALTLGLSYMLGMLKAETPTIQHPAGHVLSSSPASLFTRRGALPRRSCAFSSS